MNRTLRTRRQLVSLVMMGLSVVATLFGLGFLALILGTLIFKGLAGLKLSIFTQMTPPPGSKGGLLNAIAGSLVMTTGGVAIGAPIGMLAGIYMAEYGRGTRFTMIVRFINDILLSAPSIIIGLFVYEIYVAEVHHFSGVAGIIALAIMVVPVVVRTTEDMLLLVPGTLKEAAAAMGLPRSIFIRRIALRVARAGLITGVLLAVARVSGETAPLLFTALSNQFWSWNINEPIANLPMVIFNFALSPYKDWQQLAWTGALLITCAVLALSITARVLSAQGTRK